MSREPEMPSFTCPAIDKAIAKINAVEKLIRQTSLDDAGEMKDAIEEIEYEVGYLENMLEELRSQNDKLRNCAEYWRNKYESEVEA